MKKRKIYALTVLYFALLLVSCGDNDIDNDVTKLSDVSQGISFEQSNMPSEQQGDPSEIELTVADLEGMSEVVVSLIKDAVIYSNPSLEASEIGTVTRGNRISVYGRMEDGEWCVVSYNGRVGYMLSDCIQNNQVANVIVPSITTQTNGNTMNNGITNSPSGTQTSGNSGTPGNSEKPGDTEAPESTEHPGDSETPEGSEDSGSTEPPGDSETPGGSGDSGSAETPGGSGDSGSAETPGGSGDSGNTETPGGSETPGGGGDLGNTEIPGSTEAPSGGENAGGNESPGGESVTPPIENTPSETPSIPEGGEEGIAE